MFRPVGDALIAQGRISTSSTRWLIDGTVVGLLLLFNSNLLPGFPYRRLEHLRGCVAFSITTMGPFGGLRRHVRVAQAAFIPFLLLVVRRRRRAMLIQRER
jgi:hypothetical protein